jgi:hypothetical protein
MSDLPKEKEGSAPSISPQHSLTPSAEEAGVVAPSSNWRYKHVKIGKYVLPFYASPQVSNLAISFSRVSV